MIRHLLFCGLTVAVLAGCEPADNSATNAALQQDIERLENEIGRLEFRVYQLESALLGDATDTAGPPSEEPAAVSAEISSEEQAPESSPGRYDLTPVE